MGAPARSLTSDRAAQRRLLVWRRERWREREGGKEGMRERERERVCTRGWDGSEVGLSVRIRGATRLRPPETIAQHFGRLNRV